MKHIGSIRRIPGNKLALNMSITETFAMTAYNMTTKLGGSKSPMLPVAVNKPIAKCSSVPLFSKTGRNNPPKARIVIPDAPVNVVKKAHSRVTASAVPPGNQPKSAWNIFANLSLALLSESRKPVNVNKGIVGNIGETTIRYISAGIEEVVTPAPQKSRRAVPARSTNIGFPSAADVIKIPIPI